MKEKEKEKKIVRQELLKENIYCHNYLKKYITFSIHQVDNN